MTAARSKAAADDENPPLYIGEWIDALGWRPGKLALEAEVNEGYLSELRRGVNKTNPSPAFLRKLAIALDIEWTWFYEPPPGPNTPIKDAGKFGPKVLARLHRSAR